MFNEAMEDPDITDVCSKECLPNCGEITYSYEMDTTDLEVDPLCHHQQDTRDVRKEDYCSFHEWLNNTHKPGLGSFLDAVLEDTGYLYLQTVSWTHFQPWYLKYLKIQKIQLLCVSVSYLGYIFKVSSPTLTQAHSRWLCLCGTQQATC